MASRRSDDDDLAYGERWDKDRLTYERDRFEERDRYVTRGAPTRERVRDTSVDERFVERRAPRPWDDDFVVRERRHYDEKPRRRPSPPPELERRIYFGKERDRESHDPSPARRPAAPLRRQSSLDTFDRRPAQRLYDRDEPRAGPPAARREYRPDPYEPIPLPLPRSRALPPPRMYAERDFEDIKVSEPHRYGDDDFHAYPEHVHERELVRTRTRRDRSGSQTSRAPSRVPSRAPTHHRGRSHRGSSRSSSTSSRSSDGGGTTVTAKSSKSEYPKKGKTRIPIRLISLRAIMELQYPYVIEVCR